MSAESGSLVNQGAAVGQPPISLRSTLSGLSQVVHLRPARIVRFIYSCFGALSCALKKIAFKQRVGFVGTKIASYA